MPFDLERWQRITLDTPYKELIDIAWQYSAPAKEFEQATGISGIATTYILPHGKTCEEINRRFMLHPYTEKEHLHGTAPTKGEAYFKDHGFPDEVAVIRAQLQSESEKLRALKKSGGQGALEKEMPAYKQLQRDYKTAIARHPANPYCFTQEDEQELVRLRQLYEAEHLSLWQELKALNPELECFAPEADRVDKRNLCMVVQGVLSQFNLDDIEAFVQRRKRHPLVNSLYEQFLKPYTIEWSMSDKTALRAIAALYPNIANTSTLYARAKEAIFPSPKGYP